MSWKEYDADSRDLLDSSIASCLGDGLGGTGGASNGILNSGTWGAAAWVSSIGQCSSS